MKYDKKKPCKQCPFAPKTPGFIGPYNNTRELHELVNCDTAFNCHQTQDNKNMQMCAGYVLYMNDVFKRSKNPNVALMQDRIRGVEESLGSLSGDKIKEFHGI